LKPLLVGEANPYGGPPGNALIPDPPYCAGWNLCHKVMQLDEHEYLRRFDRVNLCDGKWNMKEAQTKVSTLSCEDRTIVLLGAKVASLFGWKFFDVSAFRYYQGKRGNSYSYVILPHPSGLSRAWSEPGAYERARSVLCEAGVL
jgi:hypothetical protein